LEILRSAGSIVNATTVAFYACNDIKSKHFSKAL